MQVSQCWYDYELETTYVVKAFEDGMAHLVPINGRDTKSYWLTENYIPAYYHFTGYDADDLTQEEK